MWAPPKPRFKRCRLGKSVDKVCHLLMLELPVKRVRSFLLDIIDSSSCWNFAKLEANRFGSGFTNRASFEKHKHIKPTPKMKLRINRIRKIDIRKWNLSKNMLSYFIPFNSIISHMTLSEKQKCMMLFYALGLLRKQNLESKQHFLPLQGRCSRYPWEDPRVFFI